MLKEKAGEPESLKGSGLCQDHSIWHAFRETVVNRVTSERGIISLPQCPPGLAAIGYAAIGYVLLPPPPPPPLSTSVFNLGTVASSLT